jgi:hypothetical protein
MEKRDRCLAGPNYFESELFFLEEEIKSLQKLTFCSMKHLPDEMYAVSLRWIF